MKKRKKRRDVKNPDEEDDINYCDERTRKNIL